MKLGYVSLAGKGNTDQFLTEVVAGLEALGLPLAGTVQTNAPRPDRPKCDMDLRILPDGPIVRISEDRGGLARGCMLDHAALEQTVAAVAARLDGAAMLIVNKFGKHEAGGRGLVVVIAEALARGMPVLVGVNALNLADFNRFAGGLAEALPADLDAVLHWCRS